MAVRIDNDKCTICGRCTEVCPVNAITTDEDGIQINEEECVDCGTCIDECPNGALSLPDF